MRLHSTLRCLAGACLLVGVGQMASAQQPPQSEGSPWPNLPMPAVDVKPVWADELFFHQWRIQRRAGTDEYRLVDDNHLRHASGTFDQCRQSLVRIKQKKRLPPMHGTGVILLHGLADTRGNMAQLARYIERHSDFTVFNVAYPSTREGIEEHAKSLARIIEHLDGIERIHLVGHSMGNIVVRRYLGDQTDPAAGRRPDPRIARMVMIGPPNHGSLAAAALGENPAFQAVLGKSGQQLGREWVWLEASLATPQFEFGIIAGGLGSERGINPLLPGDDDGVVTVQSTRLAGACDFLVVPVLHSQMPAATAVQEYTLHFLKDGCFADPNHP